MVPWLPLPLQFIAAWQGSAFWHAQHAINHILLLFSLLLYPPYFFSSILPAARKPSSSQTSSLLYFSFLWVHVRRSDNAVDCPLFPPNFHLCLTSLCYFTSLNGPSLLMALQTTLSPLFYPHYPLLLFFVLLLKTRSSGAVALCSFPQETILLAKFSLNLIKLWWELNAPHSYSQPASGLMSQFLFAKPSHPLYLLTLSLPACEFLSFSANHSFWGLTSFPFENVKTSTFHHSYDFPLLKRENEISSTHDLLPLINISQESWT